MKLRRRTRLLSLEVGLEFLDLEIELISYQSSRAAVLHYVHHLKSGGAKYVPKQGKSSGRRSVPETRLPWFKCSKIRASQFRREGSRTRKKKKKRNKLGRGFLYIGVIAILSVVQQPLDPLSLRCAGLKPGRLTRNLNLASICILPDFDALTDQQAACSGPFQVKP